MKIDIRKPSQEDLDAKEVLSWPVWEKDICDYDWLYKTREECFLLEGKVEVTDNNGNISRFEKGDFVTFPKGLACHWNIIEPVKKHFKHYEY